MKKPSSQDGQKCALLYKRRLAHFPLGRFQMRGGEARVERTFMADPVNDCVCNPGDAVSDYICVLAARLGPGRLT